MRLKRSMKPKKLVFIILFIFLGLLLIAMYLYHKKVIICGLKNHHNVCYINSVLQSLFSCDSFIDFLEKSREDPNTVLYHLKKIWEDMKKQDVLDKRPLYKEMAQDSDSLFKYDNKPGYTENFLEYLASNLEAENKSKLFLNEKNANKENLAQVFLKHTNRHVVLISRTYNEDYSDYITSIEDHINSRPFILSKIIIISYGPIYPEKPTVEVPKSLKLKNQEYELRSMIFRKRKTEKKGHFYTYSKRNNVWFRFNDETFTEMEDESFLHTDEAYMLFYEQS